MTAGASQGEMTTDGRAAAHYLANKLGWPFHEIAEDGQRELRVRAGIEAQGHLIGRGADWLTFDP